MILFIETHYSSKPEECKCDFGLIYFVGKFLDDFRNIANTIRGHHIYVYVGKFLDDFCKIF